MNLKPYIAKQELLEQYRTNLHKLDIRIAAEGGYIHAPLNIQNQYDDTKSHIERLEQEIQQIELRMIEEIPTLKEVIRKKISAYNICCLIKKSCKKNCQCIKHFSLGLGQY
jgi:hypothetical protein